MSFWCSHSWSSGYGNDINDSWCECTKCGDKRSHDMTFKGKRAVYDYLDAGDSRRYQAGGSARHRIQCLYECDRCGQTQYKTDRTVSMTQSEAAAWNQKNS